MSVDRPPLSTQSFLKDMMLLLRQREVSNFDEDRFGPEAQRGAAFNVEEHLDYLSFLFENFPAFSAANDVWEDEESSKLFRDLIEYRLVGHHHKRLPTNAVAHWEARKKAQSLDGRPSSFAPRITYSPLGLPLETVSVPFQEDVLEIDCWKFGCAWVFFLNQYYFERNGVRIGPGRGDHVIDGGMMFGESAVRMAAEVGPSGRVYGFDPVDLHCEIAKHNAAKNTRGAKIEIFRGGLAEHDARGATVAAPHLRPGYRLENGIATHAIDSLVASGEIARLDFLKLDVEGSELAALRGAAKSLVKFRPQLAISLYHQPQDFFEIPLYLDALLDDYEFYLDHYTIHSEETVLYGRPSPRHAG